MIEIIKAMPKQVIFAICGSVLGQLLLLAELHKIPKRRRPDFASIPYILTWVVNPIIAIIVIYAYLDFKLELNGWLALHIGASSPLIVKTLTGSAPKL